MSNKHYRLYIDESGDHSHTHVDQDDKRYLGITGIIVEVDYYRAVLHPQMEEFKQKYIPYNPDDPVILHRSDIIQKQGPFWRFRDDDLRKAFNDELIKLITKWDYLLITIVIDKKAHIERYGNAAYHPYHYCLMAILERYCGFLNLYNAIGDVMAESRGRKEDQSLRNAYRYIYESGTMLRRSASFFTQTLTSNKIKIKPKTSNIAGLQLADILAHPCKTDVLIDRGLIENKTDSFGFIIRQCINDKYNRHIFSGHIDGYGKKFLP